MQNTAVIYAQYFLSELQMRINIYKYLEKNRKYIWLKK